MRAVLLLVAFAAVCASATVFFKENFSGDWQSRWVVSTKKSDAGKWAVTAGKYYGDAEADKGLQTTQDAKFYHISSKIANPFSSVGKKLVIQYSVQHEQDIDCGGGYIKLFPSSLDQAAFDGDSKYNIMFGPDICGNTRKVHVIFNKGDKNLESKTHASPEKDVFTHVYTLIVDGAAQKYSVKIDGVEKKSGTFESDWDFTAPKQIKDPSQSKPANWVDREMMDDPTDVKPEGYDDIQKQIPDPEATKPSDWDDSADGVWEAPKIDNPAYKGPWRAKQIKNPDYKGAWVQPLIDNPDYVEDKTAAQYEDNAYVGFDLWQVKSGSIFDNIVITDDEDEAEAVLNVSYKANIEGEKKMKADADSADAAKRAAEEAEKKQKEEAAKSKNDDDDDDDDDKPKEKAKDEL